MEIRKNQNNLVIRAKIKLYFEYMLIFAITTIVSLVSMVIFFLNNYRNVLEISFLKNIILLFLTFLFSFFLFMWFTFGFEKIIIDKNQNSFQVIKSNYILSCKKVIKIEKIKSIEHFRRKGFFLNKHRENISELRRAFLWDEMGTIAISTGVNKFTILNGLNEKDCEKVLKIIKDFSN